MAILNNTTVNGAFKVNGDISATNLSYDSSLSNLYVTRAIEDYATTPTITSNNPKITFGVPGGGQNVGIAWTDYDAALGGKGNPAGLYLVGDQGNEYFTAPRLYEGTSRVLTESIVGDINLNSHSLLNSSSVQFTGTAISAQDNIPTALSYGKLQSYGTFNILGNTDASGDEYVNIMAGYRVTNLGNANTNGLSVGNTTLKWKGKQVATEDWASNVFAAKTNADNPINCNNAKTGVYYYEGGGPATSLGASNDGGLYSQYYNADWVAQIAQTYRTGDIFVRAKNNKTWQDWKKIATENWVTTTLPTLAGCKGPRGYSINKVSYASGGKGAGDTSVYNVYTEASASSPIGSFTVYNGTNGKDGGRGPAGPKGYDIEFDAVTGTLTITEN